MFRFCERVLQGKYEAIWFHFERLNTLYRVSTGVEATLTCRSHSRSVSCASPH